MSVWRKVGMECDAPRCLVELEAEGAEAIVSRLLADARRDGWKISRDMMTTYCPVHAGAARRRSESPDTG